MPLVLENRRGVLRELAEDLPDLPRWVEARGLLLSGHGVALFEDDPAEGFVVLDREASLACLVPRPDDVHFRRGEQLITSLLYGDHAPETILAPIEHSEPLRAQLSKWEHARARIHVHPAPHELGAPDGGDADLRWLTPADRAASDELLACVPGELRIELERALERGLPLVAVFAAERPVSFAYAAYETESLWDTAVDTLEAHRRQGLAARAWRALAGRLCEERAKIPVWGALESNSASLGLAARLGFRAVDLLVVCSRSANRSRPSAPGKP